MPDILVYVAVCNPNSKLYFGITAVSLERRVSRHLSYARRDQVKCKFHRAIRKYGPDSFTWHVVDSVETWGEACEAERLLVKTFDTTNDESGYNMTSGGDGSLGLAVSDAAKKKISSKLKAWHQSDDPSARALREKISYARKSIPASTETRRKISLTSTQRTLSAESRSKLSASKRKYSDAQVALITSEAKVIGFNAAEKKFGVPRQTISRWLWGSDRLEESRRKARENSKRWYQINHLSSCSVIPGPSG